MKKKMGYVFLGFGESGRWVGFLDSGESRRGVGLGMGWWVGLGREEEERWWVDGFGWV